MMNKKEKVIKLSKQGFSLRKISKRIGLSYQRVSQIINNQQGIKSRHRIYIDTEAVKFNHFYEQQAQLVLHRLQNGYSTIKGDRLFDGMNILKGNFWFGVTYPVCIESERYYMKNGKRMPVPENYPNEDFIFTD